MTPGELFDLDEVERFGDPWHGLAKATNAGWKIQLAGGGTHDYVGTSGGDSYVVAIPGQAAVTTSTDDAAQGMAWLNYGIMAGRAKALYGTPIGEMRWIFIDSANVPWLATANWASGLLSVNLSRFGVFGGVPESYDVSTALAPRADLGGSVPMKLRLDDIDSVGRQVVLTFERLDGSQFPDVLAVYLLTVSGAGSSAALSVAHQVDGPEIVADTVDNGQNLDRYWFCLGTAADYPVLGPFEQQWNGTSYVYPGLPAGNYYRAFGRVSGNEIDIIRKRVIGGTLIGDTFELVKLVTRIKRTLTSTPDMDSLFNPDYWQATIPGYYQVYEFPTPFLRQEERSVTGYVGIELGGTLTKVDVTQAWTTWPYLGDFPVMYPGQIDAVLKANGVNVPSENVGYFTETRLGEAMGARRFGNRAYGVLTVSQQLAVFKVLISGPVSSQVILAFAPSTGVFATAHPISGQLEVSDNEVCWV